MNYNPTTIGRIGDVKNGILVETTTMAYTLWGTAQAELFTVYNRIIVHGLWIEVMSTLAGAGTLLNFTYTSTVPIIALVDISAACTDIDGFLQGRRISFAGTSVATAAAVTYAQGVSYHPVGIPMIIGVSPTAAGVRSVGTIGCLPTIAVLTAGTGKASLLYTPVDAGAYAVALL